MCVVFKAPKSYTGEDMVEFQCHGGNQIANGVMRACIECGARIATNGEFTKRAFLKGKVSLSSAEGMMDMINAESDAEVRAGYQLLSGNLSKLAYDAQKEPVTYVENGGNTIFHHYFLSQNIEEIETLFFELQNTHREYQARFNAMKHKYELEADAKFDAELKEWEKVTLEMREEEKKKKEEYLKYKEELMIEARNLKIVIPNDLKDIYTKVSSLGK
jgi:tRNA U34 5-carboxymethylaminomethyl modifying GTPase MnmE/TrmE